MAAVRTVNRKTPRFRESLFPVLAMLLALIQLYHIGTHNEHYCTIPVDLDFFRLRGRQLWTEATTKAIRQGQRA